VAVSGVKVPHRCPAAIAGVQAVITKRLPGGPLCSY
jgi:hypothetical protein